MLALCSIPHKLNAMVWAIIYRSAQQLLMMLIKRRKSISQLGLVKLHVSVLGLHASLTGATCSSGSVTSVKYECDIQPVTGVFVILKKKQWKITERMQLVLKTPLPFKYKHSPDADASYFPTLTKVVHPVIEARSRLTKGSFELFKNGNAR